MKSLRIAIVGATGLVGKTMLNILGERNVSISQLILVASEQSIGKVIEFQGENISIVSLQTALSKNLDVAIFSAGGDVSRQWAPQFSDAGVTVIDNSSAWRMNENIKLIVPEVNGVCMTSRDMIFANPNCTTMQLVMVLKPLHDQFQIERGVVSTYQSVTGTGQMAVSQMAEERAGLTPSIMAYPHPIDNNCIPHCDVFQDNGYTKEEMKVHNETKKIMGDDSISLSCTAVRIPVMGGHGESVFLEFKCDYEMEDVKSVLSNFSGVTVLDNPDQNEYPMPINSQGKDEVFVGRLRRDLSNPRGLHLWIVSDNLRKGAATNTVQIVEMLNSAGRWG